MKDKNNRFRLIYDYEHDQAKRLLIPTETEQGEEVVGLEGKPVAAAYLKDPEIERSQAPHLVWLEKNQNDNREEELSVDIRSLYEKETVQPSEIYKRLAYYEAGKSAQSNIFSQYDRQEIEESKRPTSFYQHANEWSNRMILGDSLLVMNSLLHRESMAGTVQMVYIDPPYGIKFGSNWQKKMGDRNVKDGADEYLTHEPEQVKAYRDTWELGVHSYLSYLRDRLLVAHELLTDSGSVFVQISDENVHLVRCLLDEVFGSENFFSQITFQKTGSISSNGLGSTVDYVVWYTKNKGNAKYRQLFLDRKKGETNLDRYDYVETETGEVVKLKIGAIRGTEEMPEGRRCRLTTLLSDGEPSKYKPFNFHGVEFELKKGKHWKTDPEIGGQRLIAKNRIVQMGKTLWYKRYVDDFPVVPISDRWDSIQIGQELNYVVQTSEGVIQRCMLMTTDPSDLVLDITCGSGTTAYVAEQYGRRWITVDTSRIALTIAKQRLMTAVFPYYYLASEVEVGKTEAKGKIKKTVEYKKGDTVERDLRQGFVYEEVPHITLKSLANDEPPETETLFDKPYEDNKRVRVAGKFTVETLQNYNPRTFEQIAEDKAGKADNPVDFNALVISHLLSAGLRPSNSEKPITFKSIEPFADKDLHAIGFYDNEQGEEQKVFFFIGPRFDTVSSKQSDDAIKSARRKKADLLLILGFAFGANVENVNEMTSMGNFDVLKVRMHDDLLQDGLRKKSRKSDAMFVAIGEPDLALAYAPDRQTVQVEVLGMDIFNPLKNTTTPRSKADIAFFQIDDNYDGSQFIVRQVFFCGGDGKELDKLNKSLEALAKQRNNSKKALESTLKIFVDDEAFDNSYGYVSHPIEVSADKQVAVRIVTHFGEEVTKVLTIE